MRGCSALWTAGVLVVLPLVLAGSPWARADDELRTNELTRATTVLETGRASYHRGAYAAALEAAEEALSIRTRWLGPKHLAVAEALGDVGVIQRARASYREAGKHLVRALEIVRTATGADPAATATALDNLASLYATIGRYAEAEILYRETLDVWKHAGALDGLEVAVSWSNLASLLHAMGDLDGAQALYERVLGTRTRLQGEAHPDVATALTNLGSLLVSRAGQQPDALERARRLHERALAIRQDVLGPRHLESATSANNLGLVRLLQREHALALGLLRRALSIREKELGSDHPLTTVVLGNLAFLHERVGAHAKALERYEQVLERRRRAHPDDHVSVAAARTDLARMRAAQGDARGAAALLEQSLDAFQAVLRSSFSVLTERQQLAMVSAYRPVLDAWLGIAQQAGVPVGEQHTHVLFWKGSVFARQAALHVARGDARVAAAFASLEEAGTRLSALRARYVKPQERERWMADVAALTAEWERLERDLAARSRAFRALREELALGSDELSACLPEGVALVDYLLCRDQASRRGQARGESTTRVLAFVVRRGHAPARLDLGPLAPIAEALGGWRATLRPGTVEDRRAATVVGDRIWTPLREHVAGYSTVLVSPDGVLGQVPFVALPGDTPDRYLVEEDVFVSHVSVPQWLPRVISRDVTADGASSGDLLLVGDVDYGAAPGVSDETSGSRLAPAFSKTGTRATRAEVLAARDSFETRFPAGTVVFLRGARATEAAFRDAAPGAEWIHVASHGFAEPPLAGGRSGVHPGLRCGLAMAGANRPPVPRQDDGILTALEVATLDLGRCRLVVLSACETGLGDVVRGEGMLSLQRAFEVAQACTTVTSLWAVDDETTRMLMERFYEALWGERPISAAAALREAQRWMHLEVQEGRGPKRRSTTGKDRRLSAYFWAAFTCGGDWR